MVTKLTQLKHAYETGSITEAIRIAAKFQDLGAQRNAILDAHLAITNPRWVVGLGKSVDDSIALGLAALRVRYRF